MPIVHAEWWCLEIPAEWEAQEDDGSVTIVDPDEIGELCISVYRRDDDGVEQVDLDSLVSDLLESGSQAQPVQLAGLAGQLFVHRSEGYSWREWFLQSDSMLVLISYSCAPENEGIDASVIDEMLESFVLVDNSELQRGN